jgi:hypothetical protein
MTTKSSQFYYRDPWTVLTFPKHNRSIVYNGHTRKYEFYNLIENSKKPFNSNAVPVKSTKTYKRSRLIVLILAVLLGISVGLNLIWALI